VSVVVASHARPERLAILLDALAGQTLDRPRWELVVVHTYDAALASKLFDDHDLTRAGLLRHIPADPRRARPSIQRNIGWRAAEAPLIAFTDDDCRPEADWLERLFEAARAQPGAIVQGATRPDPREHHLLGAIHVRTLHVDPPGRFTQTCNILYERDLLERIGGFDDRATTGEDIDLAIRAQEAGGFVVGEPRALVYHAVEVLSLPEKIRSNLKWEHLAYVVKRHPQLRADCEWGVWWKPEHLRAVIALGGLIGAVRHPWMVALTLPYYKIERHRFWSTKSAVRRTPEIWLVEVAEVATFVRGSIRYRTILL
jgi:glycosyltransferase involved in cell wall biosynthesis